MSAAAYPLALVIVIAIVIVCSIPNEATYAIR